MPNVALLLAPGGVVLPTPDQAPLFHVGQSCINAKLKITGAKYGEVANKSITVMPSDANSNFAIRAFCGALLPI